MKVNANEAIIISAALSAFAILAFIILFILVH